MRGASPPSWRARMKAAGRHRQGAEQHADREGQRIRPEAALRDAGYAMAPGEHTLFAYARSPLADDVRFVERLAERGLLAVPGSLFHDPGYFRLSATATAAMIEAARAILERAFTMTKAHEQA